MTYAAEPGFSQVGLHMCNKTSIALAWTRRRKPHTIDDQLSTLQPALKKSLQGNIKRKVHISSCQMWANINFSTPDPYPKKCLHIHIQSSSENFWNLVSDIHPYPNATLGKYETNR